MNSQAVGLIEVLGLLAALEAADACCKSADVELMEYENADAAYITVKIRGDVGAVTAAIEAADLAAKRVGTVVSKHILPRPDSGVDALTGIAKASAAATAAVAAVPSDLASKKGSKKR